MVLSWATEEKAHIIPLKPQYTNRTKWQPLYHSELDLMVFHSHFRQELNRFYSIEK